MGDLQNRRGFLRAAAAAGATWATADIAHVEDALAWAARQAAAPNAPRLTALTPEQAETIEAVAARILPAVDGRPGAREAGVIYFIDRSLSTFNAAQKPLYAGGVKDLNSRAAAKWNGTQNFAALAAPQQDELLRAIEKTQFFLAVRLDTIAGMFALPSWGGNRDFMGWHMLGLAHQARFDPPFGFYDEAVNKRS
jgi:gluconate 2-dehydrogenase gamma chain